MVNIAVAVGGKLCIALPQASNDDDIDRDRFGLTEALEILGTSQYRNGYYFFLEAVLERRWELGLFVDDVDGDKKEVGERTDESQRQYKVNNRGGGRRCRPSQTGDLAESGEESRRGRI